MTTVRAGRNGGCGAGGDATGKEEAAIGFHRPYRGPLTGLVTETAVAVARGVHEAPPGGQALEARALFAALADAWQRAAADGRWQRFEGEPGALRCWETVRADGGGQTGLAGLAGGAAGEGAGSREPAATPGAARERVGEALAAAAAGRGVDGAVLPDLVALGWWTWWAECAPRPCRWQGAALPSAAALSRGLLACSADAVRLRAAVGARRRPARHPLSRVVVRLEAEAKQLLAALGAAGALLAARGEEAAVRTVVWQRLTWARSAVAALQERLVYLPAEDVPPVLYTLLEDVFPDEAPTLAAVPSGRAFASLLEPVGREGVWSTLDDGIVPVPLEDVDNPLFWPLLGRWAGLSPLPWTATGEEAAAAADATALAAFGPSYPLALITRLGARPGLGAARGSAARVQRLLATVEGEADPQAHGEARAWVAAMTELDAPFSCDGYAPEPVSDRVWEAAWAEACRRPRSPYGAENAAAAGELLEALRDGELISSRRRRAEALAPGGDRGDQGQQVPAGPETPGDGVPPLVAELYRLLDQVRDEPAAPAEILEAGWRLFTGPLREEMEGGWAAGPGSSAEAALRRLATLDVLLVRSLDVAAVHRLYAREGRTP